MKWLLFSNCTTILSINPLFDIYKKYFTLCETHKDYFGSKFYLIIDGAEIEINSLEDLKKLEDEFKSKLLVNFESLCVTIFEY